MGCFVHVFFLQVPLDSLSTHREITITHQHHSLPSSGSTFDSTNPLRNLLLLRTSTMQQFDSSFRKPCQRSFRTAKNDHRGATHSLTSPHLNRPSVSCNLALQTTCAEVDHNSSDER